MSIKESKDEQENDSGRSSPYFSTNLKGFKSAKMTDTMIASDKKEKFPSKILSNRLLISEDKVEMNIKDESFIIDPIAIIDQNHNNININSINSPSDKVQKQYRLQISTQLDKNSKLERINENIENPLNTSFNNCKRKELFLSGELDSI